MGSPTDAVTSVIDRRSLQCTSSGMAQPEEHAVTNTDTTRVGRFGVVKRVDVNGAQLTYAEIGHGEPVVFVHGGLSDLRTWEPQLPALGGRYRTISYSRRFARPNDDIEPGADDQILPHVDDLAALLRRLDAAPAHLVGNSWGASICLLTATRHPDLVRTLVLEEPPLVPLLIGPGARPHPAVVLRNLVRRPRTTLRVMQFGIRVAVPVQKAFRRGDDPDAMRTFVHGVLGEEAYQRLPEARREQMRENLSALKAQMLGAGWPALHDGDIRSVHVPTLLLTGERSPAFLLRCTDELERLLPLSERVEIPAASHAMHEENPNAVNTAIVDFLSRQ
jgi:pimeloyl-ACP methyl ester carboxylesterase